MRKTQDSGIKTIIPLQSTDPGKPERIDPAKLPEDIPAEMRKLLRDYRVGTEVLVPVALLSERGTHSRHDDLELLAESLARVGQIDAVIIDIYFVVISGDRILGALRARKEKFCRCRIVYGIDYLELFAEANANRKDLKPSSKAKIATILLENIRYGEHRRTEECVARQFGWSRTTLSQAQAVVRFGQAALIEWMDQEVLPIYRLENIVRELSKQPLRIQDAISAGPQRIEGFIASPGLHTVRVTYRSEKHEPIHMNPEVINNWAGPPTFGARAEDLKKEMKSTVLTQQRRIEQDAAPLKLAAPTAPSAAGADSCLPPELSKDLLAIAEHRKACQFRICADAEEAQRFLSEIAPELEGHRIAIVVLNPKARRRRARAKAMKLQAPEVKARIYD